MTLSPYMKDDPTGSSSPTSRTSKTFGKTMEVVLRLCFPCTQVVLFFSDCSKLRDLGPTEFGIDGVRVYTQFVLYKGGKKK